jgi:hypothetical protein
MLEEFAAGRSVFWCWREVGSALLQHVRAIIYKRLMVFVLAALFFLMALWILAPATPLVMNWARTLQPLEVLVQLGWLTGVPFLLGALAGVAERNRGAGAILLSAGLAYATPITTPFDSAMCDLCVGPGSAAIPAAIRWLTPLGSALLATLGALTIARIRRARQELA